MKVTKLGITFLLMLVSSVTVSLSFLFCIIGECSMILPIVSTIVFLLLWFILELEYNKFS